MKRQFKWDKKYLYWGITAFCVIAAAILFYMALRYLPALGKGLKALVKILSPFIWGLAISYLVLPAMRVLEGKALLPLFEKMFKKNKRWDRKRTARGVSVLCVEILFLAILAALVYLIIPQLYQSIQTIVLNGNSYVATISSWVERLLQDYPEIEQYAVSVLGTVNTSLMSWLESTVLPRLGIVVTNVTAGVYYVLTGIYNLLIGVIVSVYILSSKESFIAGCRRILYCIFPVETAEKIRQGLSFTDKTFIGFINGKLLDSAIIGLICYIFCAAVNMPYTLLVSVIVGVTNVIPFFGPFIGAVPSALIILLADPLKCLIFVIFVIVLQQLDGNFIGPKILGSTVGISGFWVMFSIILGAGLFGFWGMLLGVPVFVVIYTIITRLVNKKLSRSSLPTDAAFYANLDHIDPETLKAVKAIEDAGAEDTPSAE